MFQIDAMSREPVYEQIIHQVEQFILTDVLQPEAQIPSVRSVSMTNSINPRTILKAYTEKATMSVQMPSRSCWRKEERR